MEEWLDKIRNSPQWDQALLAADVIRRYCKPSEGELDITGASAFKYLNLEEILVRAANQAYRLKLYRCQKKTILDIGTGIGLFPLICNTVGHQCLGTDIGIESNEAALVYPTIRYALGIDVQRLHVLGRQPMSITGKFDMITAFLVTFDMNWGTQEWDFFLADAKTHLNPGGRIAIHLNKEDPSIVENLRRQARSAAFPFFLFK